MNIEVDIERRVVLLENAINTLEAQIQVLRKEVNTLKDNTQISHIASHHPPHHPIDCDWLAD